MATCTGQYRDGRPCAYRAKRDGRCLVHAGQQECPVCYSGAGATVSLACRHAFHRACIAPWLVANNLTCPVCRAAVGPDVLKRLGIRVDRRLEMMSEIEKGLFDNAFPMDDLGERFVRCYTVILRTFMQETILRSNIIGYLKKRSKNTRDAVRALRDEMRKIKAWRNEMALMGSGEAHSEAHSEAKIAQLLKMHERLGMALAWEAL